MSTPWTEFPRPISSFQQPIPLVTTEPDDNATRVVVCFSSDYLPVILGSLTQLFNQATWIATEPELIEMRQRITALQELFFQGCGDLIDVRQSLDTPCVLEKTNDGGITWTAFADLQECPPLLKFGPGQQLNAGYKVGGDVTYFRVPDGAFIADPVDAIAAIGPSASMQAQTSAKCLASANAVNGLKSMYRSVAESLDATLPDSLTVATGVSESLDRLLQVAVDLFTFVDVSTALLIYQGLYAITDWTEEAFTAAVDIFCAHASGSAGAWSFDYDGIHADFVSGITTYPAPFTLTLPLIEIIGKHGLDLLGKTTAITSYDCTDCDDVSCMDYQDNLTGGVLGPMTTTGTNEFLGFPWNNFEATLDTSGGFGLGEGSMVATVDQGDGTRIATAVVDLGRECVIDALSFWFRADSGTGAIGAEIYAYDASGTQTYVNSKAHTGSVSTYQWAQWFPASITARYVGFKVYGQIHIFNARMSELAVSVV